MATSYPSRDTTGGIWKVTDVAKNLLTKGTWRGSSLPGGRGIFAGGDSPGPTFRGAEYITISTTGNAVDYGDLSVDRTRQASVSSNTRAVWAGGNEAPAFSNIIDYFTIASTGNAADFGDMTQTMQVPAGG